jgi:hypothetical protein
MADHIRSLHRPYEVQLNEQPVRLLTVGYLAAALHRTSWTVHHWERIGLLPPPPFVINPERLRTKRHLYPEAFIAAIAEMAEHYSGRRLDREKWRAFQLEARQAYSRTVGVMLKGVTTPVPVTAPPG